MVTVTDKHSKCYLNKIVKMGSELWQCGAEGICSFVNTEFWYVIFKLVYIMQQQ